MTPAAIVTGLVLLLAILLESFRTQMIRTHRCVRPRCRWGRERAAGRCLAGGISFWKRLAARHQPLCIPN